MNIAIASSGLGHVTRGIEIWAAELASALNARGLPVSLFKGGGEVQLPYETVLPCFRRDDARTRRLFGYVPTGLTWRWGLGSVYDFEQLSFSLPLIRELRRRSIDVLHVQDVGIARSAVQARALGLISTRTILAHGTEESPELLGRFDYVQQLSPWHLEESKRAGVAKPTWTAIPNFVDVQRFAPGTSRSMRDNLGIPPDALVVLSVAAIKRHHKRIDWLLDEFQRLRQADDQLPVWLVVAGGFEADTQDLITLGKTALGDRVRFLVRVPSREMPDLYRTADLFVLTSLNEMMPIALLEALATGLPALTHRFPVADWMRGEGGKGIDMANRGELAAAMGALLRSTGERQRLAEAARRQAVEHFGTEQVVDEILKYYQRVSGDLPAQG